MIKICPFCVIEEERIWLSNEKAISFRDAYPVTEGHTLVIPKRHAESIFELEEEELDAFWELVSLARKKLFEEYKPDGMNIGINDGRAAGQTVMHAHLHLIPRRQGDMEDPRGGVRLIFPKRARYW